MKVPTGSAEQINNNNACSSDMTVIFTKMAGGVVQLFNPETAKITYKCKSDTAVLQLDAFDGIVKFNCKGAKATVDGPKTTLENCTLIKKNDAEFAEAYKAVLEAQKKFKEENIAKLQNDIAALNT